MNRALLLFDIDGTLLRTGGAGMRAMYKTGSDLFGQDFRWDGIQPAGNLDPLIFAEAAAINQLDNHSDHHQKFHDYYIRELEQELDRSRASVRAMPGIHQTLAVFRRREQQQGDVMLGLLTGNYTRAVPLKLLAVGIDPAWFSIVSCGDDGQCRADLVAVAMQRYEAKTGRKPDPRKVIVIGDTPRDIACAHAHGCAAFAVATGPHTIEELQAAAGDVVVADLADPAPLIQLVDQRIH